MRAMTDRPKDNENVGASNAAMPSLDFETIVGENSGRIYGLLYRMTGNAQDTEELVQEVFYQAYRSFPRFRGDSNVKTWLYRIAMNVSTDAIRKKTRRPVVEQGMDFEEREAAGGIMQGAISAENEFFDRESLGRVKEAIIGLPVKYRAPFVLNIVEGYSHQEIAKVLGITYGMARTRLYRAIKMLRAEIAVMNSKG